MNSRSYVKPMALSMQNKSRIGFALIFLGAIVAIFTARLAGDGSIRFETDGNTAYVGTTLHNSYIHVRQYLDDNPGVEHLVLRRMPGTKDTVENTRIGRLIRARGLTTHLEKNSIIASGAVDLFISGASRSMECGALIGVHSWSIGKFVSPKDLGRDDAQYRHEKFLKDMGVDPAFYVFTREAAEPERMHYMSTEEIEKFGLLTRPSDCN